MASKHIVRNYFNGKEDKAFRVVINRCDICDDRLECADNIKSQIDMLDEINNSYLDEYDKHEPRLLVCYHCQKEYMIQGYLI
jgi:hypothetical protein